MLGRKKAEGKPLPETADMKAWREGFKEMTIEDHDKVLKNLGLDEEDIEEFNEAEKGGRKLEDLLGVPESGQAQISGEQKTDGGHNWKKEKKL